MYEKMAEPQIAISNISDFKLKCSTNRSDCRKSISKTSDCTKPQIANLQIANCRLLIAKYQIKEHPYKAKFKIAKMLDFKFT